MTYRELINYICSEYEKNNLENGKFEAKELILHFSDITYNDLLLNMEGSVPLKIVKQIYLSIEKKAKHFPLQYILGEWSFYGNTFFVGEGVLIPRPETEEIVYRTNLYTKNKKDLVIYDLCAGTGCIGLSIAKNNPNSKVFLFEISKIALKYCNINKNSLQIDNATILEYDITKGPDFDIIPKPDIIVSNPPYISDEDMKNLQFEVKYEPELALNGGFDGLDYYRVIINNWIMHLNSNGMFMLEAGENQCEQIAKILPDTYKSKILNDLYSVPRFLYCEI